jgi:hypothetical protein
VSDGSWESSEDIEAPTADAVEQHRPLPGGDDDGEPADSGQFELPDEADEADAAEQHVEVSDDEDNYR